VCLEKLNVENIPQVLCIYIYRERGGGRVIPGETSYFLQLPLQLNTNIVNKTENSKMLYLRFVLK